MNPCAAYAIKQSLDPEEVVRVHAPLVKRIAHHLAGRLPPSVQLEDLIQAGMIGLLEAARNFDGSYGASFTTYAGTRIRGAMLDEVRRADWTPRSVHRKAREAAEAVRAIEHREGREARDSEVAEALGISVREYAAIQQDAVCAKVVSMDDAEVTANEAMAAVADGPASGPGPLQALETEGFREGLAEAIDGLPEREKLVLSLYYDEELNLREIGAVLKVSESRVCQIHGQALIRLRARMGGWLDGDAQKKAAAKRPTRARRGASSGA